MGRADIHFHLLPGVDDGATSMKRAIQMGQMALADGTTHVVATPHANYAYAYNRESHTALLQELAAQLPGLELKLGCDFHLSYENINDAIAHPERYVIGESNYLLVEFSDFGALSHMEQPIFSLQSEGFQTIVTHPERNPLFLQSVKNVEYFREHGCLIQITANALTGAWGKGSQKYARELLKKGWVDLICSDAHGLHRRPPTLSEAELEASKIVGAEAARRMVEDTPMKIFRGEAL